MVDVARFAIDLLNTYALFLIVSLALNLEAGYAGVPNFGKVMFVAGGAAIAGSVCGRLAAMILGINTLGNYNGNIAIIISKVNTALSANPLLSLELLLLGIILAAGVGAVMGFVASYPAIRLREDYLGMLLLAAAQFFQLFLAGYPPFIGGTAGISVPDVFGWLVQAVGHPLIVLPFGNEVGVRDLVLLPFLVGFAVLGYIYFETIARSPLGRTLRAVRDNEVASRALGKNDVAIRRNVIVIASAVSAMAGALLTFQVGAVGPGSWTRITWTFWIWVMVIVGGSANNLGVAVGAFLFTSLFKVLDLAKFQFSAFIPFDVNWLEYLAFASLLISFLIVRPGGIIPEKSSTTLPRQTVVNIVTMRGETPANQAEKSSDEPDSTSNEDKSTGDTAPPAR